MLILFLLITCIVIICSSAEVIDDPTERRLKIARFLHQPRSVEELVEHFFQSDRTIRKDLAALEEGISFMGQRIQIRKVREGGKIRYQSTLHPVFLPLNLTEVYALTAGLLAINPGTTPCTKSINTWRNISTASFLTELSHPTLW